MSLSEARIHDHEKPKAVYTYIHILIHPCILGDKGVTTKILTSPQHAGTYKPPVSIYRPPCGTQLCNNIVVNHEHDSIHMYHANMCQCCRALDKEAIYIHSFAAQPTMSSLWLACDNCRLDMASDQAASNRT